MYRFIDTKEEALALGLEVKGNRPPHIHTLNGKPLRGATELKKIIGKGDGLMQWYADMSSVAALSLPVQDIKAEYEAARALTDKVARSRAMRALCEKYPDFEKARYAAVDSRDESADKGTERHGKLEDYVSACIASNEGKPMPMQTAVPQFVDWAIANVEQFYFTEAYCYHEGLWFGGIGDIGMKLKDGRRVVGDHKSSREAYPDQFLQCAIYDVGLAYSGGLTKTGEKLFEWELADGYVIFPFRSDPFTPEFRWNAEEWRKGVEELEHLNRLLN